MDLTALYSINYGLYIVSSKWMDQMNGQIANTIFQITSEPPTLGISINQQNLTHSLITQSQKFTVSVLDKEAPMTLIGQFGFKSGRDIHKFENVSYIIGENGLPVVTDHIVATFELDVVAHLPIHTHTLFVGKITNATVLSKNEPMTYAYYHQVKKGLTPKNAATYQKAPETNPIKTTGGDKMSKYRCLICGYEYDPAVGDIDGGIQPGTPFEEIPDSWVCPICGASKDQFEKIA